MTERAVQAGTVAGAGRPRSVALSVLTMLDAALGLELEQWCRPSHRPRPVGATRTSPAGAGTLARGRLCSDQLKTSG